MAARRMRSPAAGDIRLLQVLAINGDMGEVAIAGHWARVRTVRQSR
ncbi:hypothetical protein Saa2_00663 [Streptomyces acidiscabies]|nr:hypothetical protein Saa2_00663 [Streptomyces acidiscabies]